jgi:hypothetical protein
MSRPIANLGGKERTTLPADDVFVTRHEARHEAGEVTRRELLEESERLTELGLDDAAAPVTARTRSPGPRAAAPG